MCASRLFFLQHVEARTGALFGLARTAAVLSVQYQPHAVKSLQVMQCLKNILTPSKDTQTDFSSLDVF